MVLNREIVDDSTITRKQGPATTGLRACQNLIEMGESLKAEWHLRPGAQLVRTSPRGAATTTWMRQTHVFIIRNPIRGVNSAPEEPRRRPAMRSNGK
jgi:hypothetical protein